MLQSGNGPPLVVNVCQLTEKFMFNFEKYFLSGNTP